MFYVGISKPEKKEENLKEKRDNVDYVKLSRKTKHKLYEIQHGKGDEVNKNTWKNDVTQIILFDTMTGRTVPSSDGLLAEVFWGFPRL